MSKIELVLGAVALLAPASAMAWPQAVIADPYGARSIVHDDVGSLQPRLAAAVAKGDRKPEVLLNLGAIYARQNNPSAARAMFQMVLDQPNMDMATLKGTAWSHDLARRGLARVGQMAAR